MKGPNWNNSADFYSEFAFCELEDTKAFLEAFGIEEGDTFLDVCCGPGRVSVVAAQMGAVVTGIDSADKMLEHAKENAERFNVADKCTFRLMDWNHVLPGQNLHKADIAFASRCGAISDVEKMSKLAKKKVAVQIFADAPSIPMLLGVVFSGCEMKEDENKPERPPMPPGAPGMPPGKPGMPPMGPGGPDQKEKLPIYLEIAYKAYKAGYDPNIKVFPERFRKTFANEDEALKWICSLRKNLADGQEERVLNNLRPFLTPVEGGVEFCIATKAAIIWWNVD